MNTLAIKSTNVIITEEVRTYAEKKITSACRAFVSNNPTTLLTVELEYVAIRNGAKYRAEITLQVNDYLFRSEAWQETLHAAVDVAADKLEKELRTNKEKRERKKRQFMRNVKDFLRGIG